ncbi:MAG: hydrogenase maturation protease [Ignavibacteria bacterium]|nr:hydrogenase maturation protease [Ignavibacteria bacterium]
MINTSYHIEATEPVEEKIMEESKTKTLILGMGNTLLSDDAIGILVKRLLELCLKDIEHLHFEETSWGGFRIIDLIKGFNYVIVIDAMKTGNCKPGTIKNLKVNDFLPTLRFNSYHDINFITAVKLAEAMEEKVPTDIDIYTIEIVDNRTISFSLSREVEESITECSKEILNRLCEKNIISESEKSKCLSNLNLFMQDKKSFIKEKLYTEEYNILIKSKQFETK